MMQKLSQQEKEEINQLPKEDLHCLKSGMLYTKDVDYYMDYLKEQDEIICRKIHRRKPSLFYTIGFVIFNNTNNSKCNTMTPRCARGKNIFLYEVYLYTYPPWLVFYVCSYLHGRDEDRVL